MCGRYTNKLTARDLVTFYHLKMLEMPERYLPAHYNICPTQTIDLVIEQKSKRELVPMRWRLVPSWWKKSLKELHSTFNARAETVAEKPMFRAALKRQRVSFRPQVITGGRDQYKANSLGTTQRVMALPSRWRVYGQNGKNIEVGEPPTFCF